MSLPISLEFFPPKTPEGAAKLRTARQALYELKPEFCSVTYGAGGSTQEGTFGTVKEILEEGVDGAAHFSCVGATRDKVREQLAILRGMGVKRLVALRGDLPSGYGAGGEFQYASDLVAFIRAETGNDFRLEVACYPEVHPQARSPEADLQAYAAKIRAGADAAITQYFYNADSYFRFVEEADRLGLHVPIVPGVMPIISSTQLMRFSDACGAEISVRVPAVMPPARLLMLIVMAPVATPLPVVVVPTMSVSVAAPPKSKLSAAPEPPVRVRAVVPETKVNCC